MAGNGHVRRIAGPQPWCMTDARTSPGRRLFARWYPWLMARAERAGQADIRRAQLSHARGKTLEIGAGNGFSIPHYTGQVDELTLIEPNRELRALLAGPVRDAAPRDVVLADGDVHALDYPDATFDTVTASLVFCSVSDPRRALAEVHRVLKPGGRFLFHEHVRGTGVRAFLQDLMTPLQRWIADGCHANRDFESLLSDSPLELETLTRTRMPASVPTIVPLVVGTARRVA
jgi:ubiquinone/menaquinone biosynthesis C-methylase UbiE